LAHFIIIFIFYFSKDIKCERIVTVSQFYQEGWYNGNHTDSDIPPHFPHTTILQVKSIFHFKWNVSLKLLITRLNGLNYNFLFLTVAWWWLFFSLKVICPDCRTQSLVVVGISMMMSSLQDHPAACLADQ